MKWSERHTAENLATELQRCIDEWGLQGRIQAVVTDSAANVTAPVRLAGLTHLFILLRTYTLNLIVPNGNRAIKLYYMRPEFNPVKLKNDVVTRWNSAYDMFRRIYEIREQVEAAIAVL